MSRPVCPLPVACRPAFRAAAALALLLAAAPAAAQGFLPDPDPVYRSVPEQPRYRAFLPPEVDLSGGFPAPGNQGDQASCTAWAVGYAVRSYYEQERRNWSVATSDHQFSPAYIYNALVAPSGNCEAPTSMSAALDLLRTTGVPTLADFPSQ